jgi:chorismate mutase
VNARLELVAELKRVKELRGLAFHDPEREEWLLRHLAEGSRGRLSEEGLRALYAEILALTKRELGDG